MTNKGRKCLVIDDNKYRQCYTKLNVVEDIRPGAESYHRHPNHEFYTPQPNIYIFVETLLYTPASSRSSLTTVKVERDKSANLRELFIEYVLDGSKTLHSTRCLPICSAID